MSVANKLVKMEHELNELFPNTHISVLCEDENNICIDGTWLSQRYFYDLKFLSKMLQVFYPASRKITRFNDQSFFFHYSAESFPSGPRLIFTRSGRFFMDRHETLDDVKLRLSDIIELCKLSDKYYRIMQTQ